MKHALASSRASSLLLGALLSACSGGGGSSGGTVTGLAAPEQLEIVTVEEPAGTPSDPAGFALDSHYMTDEASSHVYDPALGPVQMVNEILCFMAQTAADRMVNQGPYLAQVDESRCATGGDPAGDATGQSSGANAVAPSLWVVESERASNTAPQTVHVWIPEDEEGYDSTIFVDLSVTAEAGAADPFGAFELDFAGAVDAAGLADPLVRGALETLDDDVLGFDLFFEHGDVDQVPEPGDGAERVAVRVAMAADQTTGQARVKRSYRYNDPSGGDSGLQEEEYLLDFDADEVLREIVGGPTERLSRRDWRAHGYRYNLYHASGPQAGQRVELESGFQIRTEDGDFGWLGYWGLWLPNDVAVEHGDVIERVEPGSPATEEYTLVMAPGKLIEHVKHVLPLAEAEGMRFEWWDGSPPSRYEVEYSGGVFSKVAVWDDASMTWTPLGSPEAIDTFALGFLNMYSQALGGPVGYVHGDVELTYFATAFVNGASALFDAAVGGTVELHGFVQCLRPDLSAAEAEAGDVYLPDATDVGTPHVFRFLGDDLTLYHDADGSGTALAPVGLAEGEVPASGPFQWGLRTGPLVTDSSALVNPWDVWSQDVFYVYETGPNPWNRYTAARDALGDDVVFDAPIQFTYVHSEANDRNDDATHDGARVLLAYGGRGSLWGIPHTGVDFTGDGLPDRFFPAFSIADGVLMGPNGNEYVVRAIESELTLDVLPLPSPTLDTARAAALALPDATIYSTPANGDVPEVVGPPAVVDGVVQ